VNNIFSEQCFAQSRHDPKVQANLMFIFMQK